MKLLLIFDVLVYNMFMNRSPFISQEVSSLPAIALGLDKLVENGQIEELWPSGGLPFGKTTMSIEEVASILNNPYVTHPGDKGFIHIYKDSFEDFKKHGFARLLSLEVGNQGRVSPVSLVFDQPYGIKRRAARALGNGDFVTAFQFRHLKNFEAIGESRPEIYKRVVDRAIAMTGIQILEETDGSIPA